MTLPLLLLLAASAANVELVDEVVKLPRAEWRYVELHIRQQPVTVTCRFDAEHGSRIRVALLAADESDRMRQELPHGMMAVTPAGARGRLQYTVHTPGDYYIVIDNRDGSAKPARVRVRASLDFAPAPEPAVRTLSRQRRAVVIGLSCLLFLGIAGFAGRSLLRGMRR